MGHREISTLRKSNTRFLVNSQGRAREYRREPPTCQAHVSYLSPQFCKIAIIVPVLQMMKENFRGSPKIFQPVLSGTRPQSGEAVGREKEKPMPDWGSEPHCSHPRGPWAS